MKEYLQTEEKHQRQLHKLELRLILTYAIVILVAIVSISIITLNLSGNTLKTKMGAMISTIDAQMTLDLNGYLQKIEETSTLIFMNEKYYEYDASDSSYDEFEHLQMRTAIAEKLQELSLMENFSDFGIVYTDGTSVGNLSNGSKKLFGDDCFHTLETMIRDPIKKDGWFIGYQGNYERMYYVKQLNAKAVLVTAFYTSELENVFEKSSEISDMTIRLEDGKNRILYSSDETEKYGDCIPEELVDMTADQPDSTILNNGYLVAVNTSEPGWRVMCSIPTDIVLKENGQLRHYILILAILITAFTVVLGKILSRSITNPMTNIVTNLDQKAAFDQLTGVLRKKNFEQEISWYLKSGQAVAGGFVLIDIDDFKQINDQYGHLCGDQVLAEVGQTLHQIFRDSKWIGRIGGDEFAVLIELQENSADVPMRLQHMAEELYRQKDQVYGEQMKKVNMTFSLGLAIYPDHGKDFVSLYKKADHALYHSKNTGKSQVHVYTESEAEQSDEM